MMRHWFFIMLVIGFTTAILGFKAPFAPNPEALGERLFSDPILSLDSTISCGSCHIPEFAFCDTAVFSKGVGGTLGKRNSPGITNMKFRPHFFYDGRAATLEMQVLMPIRDPLEMRFTAAAAVARLNRHPEYRQAFLDCYGKIADTTLLAGALAAFVRTLETSDTPFDRWMQDKPRPMSEAAVRGREVFMKKGKCFDCHFSPDFTGDEFRNVGTFTGRRNLKDRGRFDITGDSSDLGKFKVPGLRNVALTAPYMHNGMFKTLEEVIEFYDQPNQTIPGGINRDTLLNAPLNLTVEEKSDLKLFLEALTDDRFVRQR
jgi:cytochrome c peroxidase